MLPKHGMLILPFVFIFSMFIVASLARDLEQPPAVKLPNEVDLSPLESLEDTEDDDDLFAQFFPEHPHTTEIHD